jgi:hypothetical protein
LGVGGGGFKELQKIWFDKENIEIKVSLCLPPRRQLRIQVWRQSPFFLSHWMVILFRSMYFLWFI